MRELKFLITSQYSHFIAGLFDYLFSLGHCLALLSSEDNEIWREKYGDKIEIIRNDSLDYSEYDYLLDFQCAISAAPLMRIVLNIEQANNDNAVNMRVLLKKGQQESILWNANSISITTNLTEIHSILTEGFIDSVITLMRTEPGEIPFDAERQNDNLFEELIRFENQSKSLNQFYLQQEANDEKFELSALRQGVTTNTYRHLSIAELKLTATEVELVVLCALMLINSRRASTFKYDFLLKQRCITKFIHADPLANFSTLANQLQNEKYAISENYFFKNSYSSNHRAEILVAIDSELNEPETHSDYVTKIGYDTQRHQLTIEYPSDLYVFDEIETYIRYFDSQLTTWRLHDSPANCMLCREARLFQKQLNELNETTQQYPDKLMLHHLFEEQVKRTPHSIALVFENRKFSYQELNESANRLAHFLNQRFSIKPDKLIALCLGRSEQILIAILGILKSGGAYVPIDPTYPGERLSYILGDTQAEILITDKSNQENIHRYIEGSGDAKSISVVCIDDQTFANELKEHSSINPGHSAGNSNLAYVIYTSGTTGVPKGVMVEHKSVVNLSTAQCSFLQLTQQHRASSANCLWFSNYVFDAHVWEVFCVLASGNTLHIANDEIRKDIELLRNYVDENQIEIATLPPAMLTKDEILNLKTLVVAGEVANENILNTYRSHGTRVINAYGPTESTVCATFCEYTSEKKISNIGMPLANITCYVLDEQLFPIPVGAVGELYIGGVGLARGYLRAPELTQQVFIRNPYQTSQDKARIANDRIYKTGDYVRRSNDGDIEYIGRNDHQIKIRGFRVELSEIECVLNRFPGIMQSVVLPSLNNAQQLIAYYTAKGPLIEPEILIYLKSKLPAHMLPQYLIFLEKLPLTTSGKLDRKLLPLPKFESQRNVTPRHCVERDLYQIFFSILGLSINSKISIHDDFFDLGGTSILAMQLVSTINKSFNTQLRSANIYSAGTIHKLSHLILQSENEFKLITHLSVDKQKENLFLIHPGMSGTEVYTSLARKMSDRFSCYGVDNYNLNHHYKVDNLTELATIYLNAINEIRAETHRTDQPYLFGGWSIGGLIALKMAYLLEQLGRKDVFVMLLDTFLMDDKLLSVLDYKFDALRDFLKSKGHADEHINKIISNIDCENTVVKQSMEVGQLNSTKILLFKAMKNYDLGILKNYTEDADRYLTELAYNNLEHITDVRRITLIQLNNVNHSCVCTEEDVIFEELQNWIHFNADSPLPTQILSSL